MMIIDSDTHIAEPLAMWDHMDKDMYSRRPVLASVPEDTLYGPRNAFWLIDGNIVPKPNGKGSYRLVTPSATEARVVPQRQPHRQPRDHPARGETGRYGPARHRCPGYLSDALPGLPDPRYGVGYRPVPRLQPVHVGGASHRAEPADVDRGAAAALHRGLHRRDAAGQGARRRGHLLSRHGGGPHAGRSPLLSGLRRGRQAGSAHLHPYRHGGAVDHQPVQLRAELLLRPGQDPAGVRLPGPDCQPHTRGVSGPAHRLHRSLGGLGAVHAAYPEAAAQKRLEAQDGRRAVRGLPHVRRLRGRRGRPLSRGLHRRGPYPHRLGLRPSGPVARARADRHHPRPGGHSRSGWPTRC